MPRFITKYFVALLISSLTIFVIPISLHSQAMPLSNPKTILFPNFTQSLIRGGKSQTTYLRRLGNKNKNQSELAQTMHQLKLLQNSYKQSLSIIKANAALKGPEHLHIPRIIHQIWLGSPVPKKYQEWMNTWMNWHGWEYKLWTDKEVKELALVNQEIYDKVNNYGQKSDILRMELLYMMGGIYVDTDFECRNADFFEVLHKNVDFYAGIEPLEHAFLRINNAIIGCAPGHPLMQKMIQELPAHFEATKNRWALISTGPVFMTKMIYAYLEQEHSEVNMLLPCSLVYPFTSSEVDHSSSPESLIPMKETVAIHYWSKSWVKK
ncbi:MAG: hypothetical protein H0X29_00330 [Parachlamydiaceae bacterium]|nr:hypothetical protein [Parachlamydiaceae bacterium]